MRWHCQVSGRGCSSVGLGSGILQKLGGCISTQGHILGGMDEQPFSLACSILQAAHWLIICCAAVAWSCQAQLVGGQHCTTILSLLPARFARRCSKHGIRLTLMACLAPAMFLSFSSETASWHRAILTCRAAMLLVTAGTALQAVDAEGASAAEVSRSAPLWLVVCPPSWGILLAWQARELCVASAMRWRALWSCSGV